MTHVAFSFVIAIPRAVAVALVVATNLHGLTLAAEDSDSSMEAQPTRPIEVVPLVSPLQDQPAAALTPPRPAETLQAGLERAQAEGRPALVIVGGASCPWCRRLDAELQQPAVQTALRRWTVVHASLDHSPEVAARLAVGPIPAIRALRGSGATVASRDGYLPGEALISWLDEHYAKAAAEADAALTEANEPGEATVLGLVRHLGDRDPLIREAAIGRLASAPAVAGPQLMAALQQGNLAVRLSALEVFSLWGAPVNEVDPWQLQTLTADRLERLTDWQSTFSAPTSSENKELSADELVEAGRQIDRLMRMDSAAANALSARLARHGRALLPELHRRLEAAATTTEREKLLALRYRLAASDALMLRFPGGVSRLANSDPLVRRKAADQLASLANSADQPLLLELFSDSDPLIRELALRGLEHLGGETATASLVQLLQDPEPNVRAAVLKQLTEQAAGRLVPQVARYVLKETDPDLLVHAIRYFREVPSTGSLKAVMPLLEHAQWQVRAEAAETLGKMAEHLRDDYRGSRSGASTEQLAEVYAALAKRLDDEDPFVIGRAVDGLSAAPSTLVVEPMLNAADRHPELAAHIIGAVASRSDAGAIGGRLRKYITDERPAIRQAALLGLEELGSDRQDWALPGLRDADRQVRIATAELLAQSFQGMVEGRRREIEFAHMEARHGGTYTAPSRPLPMVRMTETADGEATITVEEPGDSPDGTNRAQPADPPPLPGHESLERMLKLIRPLEESAHPDWLGGNFFPVQPEDKGAPFRMDPALLPGFPGPKEQSLIDLFAEMLQGKPAEETRPMRRGKDVEQLADWDAWLQTHYASQRGQADYGDLVQALQEMLRADDAAERMAAAVALIPLAQSEVAMPVLQTLVRGDATLVPPAARILPWLPWSARVQAFNELRALAANDGVQAQLIDALVRAKDGRAAAVLWNMLDEPDLTRGAAVALSEPLLETTLGSRYDASRADDETRRQVALTAESHLKAPTEAARLVALIQLAHADADLAREAAAKIAEDKSASEEHRGHAFQILLANTSSEERTALAIPALSGDPQRQELAILVLATGPDSLQSLSGGSFYIPTADDPYRSREAGPIIPTAPAGLAVEHVLPALEHPEARVRAYAGYLLALLGDRRGLDHLLTYWKQDAGRDYEAETLVFRAIARLDASDQLPVLRTIYNSVKEDSSLGEFYWTIRIMSGEDMLRFRKQIRSELDDPDRLR